MRINYFLIKFGQGMEGAAKDHKSKIAVCYVYDLVSSKMEYKGKIINK